MHGRTTIKNQYTFLITSRSVLPKMRNMSDKSCRENQNTHFVFCNFFFSPENRAVYEIMWKNMVETGRSQLTIRRMRIARWIPNATNKHSEYVTVIAFLPQQWLHELSSVLRYTYIACLVVTETHCVFSAVRSEDT
jgi:hypothetical protein